MTILAKIRLPNYSRAKPSLEVDSELQNYTTEKTPSYTTEKTPSYTTEKTSSYALLYQQSTTEKTPSYTLQHLSTTEKTPSSLQTPRKKRFTKNKMHSRSSSLILPDGILPENYGLPTIKRVKDVDGLQRFEVIRYLDAFNLSHEGKNENEMKTLLKDLCVKR